MRSDFGDTTLPFSLTIMRWAPSDVSTTRPRHSLVQSSTNAEAPATDQRIHHEVERPAQVLGLRDRHRRPSAESPLAAATLAHGQPFFFVKPVRASSD